MYCGAIGRGDFPCNTCGAEVQRLQCVACRNIVFAGTDRCPCGASLEVKHAAACPRCVGVALAGVQLEDGVKVLQCGGCGGCFLRVSAWTEVLNRTATGAGAGADALLANFVAPPPSRQLPRQALLAACSCPDCRKPMDRVTFGAQSSIVVDICNTHGIWVDAGELVEAVDFVRTRDQHGGKVPKTHEQIRADYQHSDAIAARRQASDSRDARIDSSEQQAARKWLPPHVRVALSALDHIIGK
jgi:Zn-finger nucleic acid-binding protein